MPTYCYKSRETGEVRDVMLKLSEASNTITIEGEEFERDLATELKTGSQGILRTSAKSNSLWPKKSVSAGISENQVGKDGHYKDPQARARFPHHKFDKKGNMVFNSMREYRKQTQEVGLEAP